MRLLPRHIARLEAELGVSPTAADLSPTEGRVLAALARAPLGLPSARAVASRAAVSPTAAGRALERLSVRGLVKRERRPVAMGGVREVELIRVNVCASEWRRLAPALGAAKRPRRRTPPKDARVPPRLRHLFWNTAPEQLDVDAHGGYIARRLLSSDDVEGLAWGADHLSPADWTHASCMRGLEPDRRALARNLAAASE
jgi:DNA-binding transcriptional MocR family regulator